MGKIVYLSGPIGNGHTVDARTMYQNVRRGEELMFKMMKMGFTVICPHLSYHAWLNWAEDMEWQRWIDMDMDFVRICDIFYRMRPSEYGPSRGADREEEEAKRLGKPIVYLLEDLELLL